MTNKEYSMKKIEKEQIIELVKNISNDNILVVSLDGYKNTKSKILLKDKRCNHPEFYKTLSNLRNGSGCPKCGNDKKSEEKKEIYRNHSSHKNKEDLMLLLDKNFLEAIDISNYTNSKSKIKVKSKLCDHPPFFSTYNRIQQGQLCPTCGNIKSKDGERLTEELLFKKMESHIFFREYNVLNFNEYKNINTKNIKIKHLSCGKIFTTRMNNFLNMHGCPYCRRSLIETKVENYLVKNNIPFERNKRDIAGLYGHKRPLEIDFIIYLNNEKLFLELDGELHFKKKSFISEHSVEKTREYDKKKEKYFLENEGNYLVIPY